jgi:hypothetical protein
MIIAELYALPTDTRVRWDSGESQGSIAGEVVGMFEGKPLIRWTDGQEYAVTEDDDDLKTFAEELKVLKPRTSRASSK